MERNSSFMLLVCSTLVLDINISAVINILSAISADDIGSKNVNLDKIDGDEHIDSIDNGAIINRTTHTCHQAKDVLNNGIIIKYITIMLNFSTY